MVANHPDFPPPPNPHRKLNKWTAADESKLNELTERKRAFTEATRGPLVKFVRDNGLYDTNEGVDVQVDRFIKHADTIRDLLEPFDSGTRPAEKG